MRKGLIFLTGIVLAAVVLSACMGMGILENVPNDSTAEQHKATPEEAIQQYMEKEGMDPDAPHSYLVIDKYLVLLYNESTISGSYDEQNGYEMYLPWSSKMRSYVPDIPPNFIRNVLIIKSDGNYFLQIFGTKEVAGVSAVEENSPIKVYDSNGNELEKLYNEDDDNGTCVWITVLKELPKDYVIYAEDGNEKYTVIDARTIKRLIG